jgi:exodeoxyribonuclease VII large subunit
LGAAKDRLDRTGRLLDSLSPAGPLKRGYVRVDARPSGAVVTSAAEAKRAGALTLHFADGTIDARVERATGKTYAPPQPEQPSLL